MSDKRNRSRLFGKPLPNPIDEAAKAAERAAKEASAKAKSAAGELLPGNALSDAAEKASEVGRGAVESRASAVSGGLNDRLVDINALNVPVAAKDLAGDVTGSALDSEALGSTASGVANDLSAGAGRLSGAFKDGVAGVAGGVGSLAKGAVDGVDVADGIAVADGVAGGVGKLTKAADGVAGGVTGGVAKLTKAVDGIDGVDRVAGASAIGESAKDAVSGEVGSMEPTGMSTVASTSTVGNASTRASGATNTGNTVNSSNNDSTGNTVSTGNSGSSGNTVSTVNTVKTTDWVPHSGRKFLPLALGALGLAGLTGIQAVAAKGRLEKDLRSQSLAKLKDEFPDLKVRFDGRDAYLDGTVVDAESRKRAHDLVRRIKGVRHVKDPKVIAGSPAAAAAQAQVSLTIDTTIPAVDSAAEGMASIAAVTGDTIPETTVATPSVTSALAPVDTVAAVAVDTIAPTTIPETIPATVPETILESTTVVPASVLANSVPTTIVAAPSTGDQPTATVVPTGEPIEPIYFGRASTDLEAGTTAEIDRIAAFLSANPTVELGVAGYADGRGTKLQNMALAKVRAENVKQALIDRGIPAPRVKAVWFGDRSPVADNATEEGRAFNRRVEFRFFDAAIDAASAYGQDVSFTG